MKILTDQLEILRAQEIFSSSLNKFSPMPVQVTIGYQSGSVKRTVKWIPQLDIWAYFGEPPEGKSEGRRFWNAFGLGKPEDLVSIICEINPPLEGIRRKVAGAFVKNQSGEIWVAHRGRLNIAGGMTMKFFRQHYPKPYVSVVDGNATAKLILIGRLGLGDFGISLRDFILEVDRIKEIGREVNR